MQSRATNTEYEGETFNLGKEDNIFFLCLLLFRLDPDSLSVL